MIGVLKSELFKLRTTRATKIVVICSVVLPAIIFSLTCMFAFSNGEVGDSLASMVGNFAPLTGLLLGVVGVLCSTQEYSQGTIRITLVATPSRLKVFVAKLLTTVVVSVVSALLMLLLCLVPSQVILSTRNVTFELIGSDIRVLFSAVILSAFLSILGLSLGLIFKSSPGAISALLLWPTILEGMVFGLLSVAFDNNMMKFAPVQGNGFRLIATYVGTDENTWLVSLTYFSAFVAVFATHSDNRKGSDFFITKQQPKDCCNNRSEENSDDATYGTSSHHKHSVHHISKARAECTEN
jgi:ABC-2 type transport system permease protein